MLKWNIKLDLLTMGIGPTKYNSMKGLGPGRQAPKPQPPHSGLAACMTAYFQQKRVLVNNATVLIVERSYEDDCIACLLDYGGRPTNIIWSACHQRNGRGLAVKSN